MAINRSVWDQRLTNSAAWLCPACGVGQLRLKEGSLSSDETRPSREARENPDWDPDWIRSRFVALLTCNNESCGEVSMVHGEGCYEPLDLDPANNPFVETFYPRFISPSPDLFEIPGECPEAVSAMIRTAFVSSWGAYEAAANQIRVALELLLTERRIPRYTSKDGRRKVLTLHSRIDKFAATSSAKTRHLGELMKAVKWLGNVGSHCSADGRGKLRKADVYDALDLLQYVVDELYSKPSTKMARLAKQINRRKGPARR